MKIPKKINILIVAGGTGGHISPGIALYEELIQANPTFFLTLYRNKDYDEFKKKNIKPFFYDAPRISKNIIDNLLFIFKMIISIIKVLYLIQKYDIQTIIGMGGYPTVPALICGIILRKKIYLCEQNVIPGNVTKYFSYFAKNIFLNFPIDSIKYSYLSKKSIITGNPIRKEIYQISEKIILKNSIKTIFITGGSQGAKQINEMIWNLWNDYPEFSQKFHWIIQTGKIHYKEFSERIKNLKFYDQIECFDFTTEIYTYFKKADLLICRAGAGNISEGILFLLPMILIPYPYAKDNHQWKNAEYIENQKAGIMIHQKSFDSKPLYIALLEMIKNYQMYQENIKKIKYSNNPAIIIKNYVLSE